MSSEQICPKFKQCELVKIGKCPYFHPKCRYGPKCRFLQQRECHYEHPPSHFHSNSDSVIATNVPTTLVNMDSNIKTPMPPLQKAKHTSSTGSDSDTDSDESTSEESSTSKHNQTPIVKNEPSSAEVANNTNHTNKTQTKKENNPPIANIIACLRDIEVYRLKERNLYEVNNVRKLMETINASTWNDLSELEGIMGCPMSHHESTLESLKRTHGRIDDHTRRSIRKLLKDVKEKCQKEIQNVEKINSTLTSASWFGTVAEFIKLTDCHPQYYRNLVKGFEMPRIPKDNHEIEQKSLNISRDVQNQQRINGSFSSPNNQVRAHPANPYRTYRSNKRGRDFRYPHNTPHKRQKK